MNYSVKIDLKVFDPDTLFKHALEYAIEKDDMPEEEAREMLYVDGKVDIHACLIMLLDPGTLPGGEIYGSEVGSNEIY